MGTGNKNVIITGASRGIGKALATVFASSGYNLYLASLNAVALYKTMEELLTRFPGVTIKAKPFDLSIKNEVIALGDWILDQNISIDILINNAGSFQPGNVHDEPDGTLESQLAINLYSAYHLTRKLVPAMILQSKEAGRSSHIFNMCSIASLQAYNNGGAYSISKFALYGFNKNLREELKPYGIKVTAVVAGAVMTDSWEGFDNSNHRIMEAEDIARMVLAATQLSMQACTEEILLRPVLGDL
jgi:short-subunit dehydrogenase